MRAPGVTGTRGMGGINIVERDIRNADAFVHFSVLSRKLPGQRIPSKERQPGPQEARGCGYK